MAQNKALALKRLNAVLDRVPELKQMRHDSSSFERWHRDTRVALARIFGKDSEHVDEFKQIHFIALFVSATDHQEQEEYVRGLSRAESALQSMIDEIEEYWPDEQSEIGETVQHLPQAPETEVFIVHGKDVGTKEEVARFLEQLGVETVVLNEIASKGKTIIEKFEAHANVGYAVVLLTGDDDGALKGEKTRPRARQNVVFELGFFIGKLGRDRVCALTKGEVEIPSDYAGVLYIPMESDAWKLPLIKELKAAGFQVDANRAFE